MKVSSTDSQSWFLVNYNQDQNGYDSFSIEVNFDVGHSAFHGKNTDVHFLNLAGFIIELDAFILNRNLQPRLLGTYDSVLVLKAEATGNITVSLIIGSSLENKDYRVQGSFEFLPEKLNDVLRGFQQYERLAAN